MDAPTLEVDPHDFARQMLAVHEANTILGTLRDTHDVLTVEYEPDVLHGDLRTNESLFTFVDVPPREATWLEHRKVSPSPETYISNYAELKRLQEEIQAKLDRGRAVPELRSEYSPPLLKSLYRTGKHWVEHPGYAAYQIQRGVKQLFRSSDSSTS